ncbi:MAG: hypothetical protein IRY85_22355 [Micromonosporaceae bacterium]|nr:hypothetical protein [Micromonosporaceae bacterium]
MTLSTQGLSTPHDELGPPIPLGSRVPLNPAVRQRSAWSARSPRPMRRLATVASAVLAALVGVLLVTSPAYAADEIRVTIDGLPDTLQAGGVDDFRVTFTNQSGESITGIVAVVAVALPGAVPESISVQRNAELSREVTDDGTVIFTDANAFDLGRSGGNARRRMDFSIYFYSDAPSGEAVVTVAAYARDELLGSTSTTIEVRGAATTPPNTDPGIVPTFEAGPSYSIAPIPEDAVTAPPNSTVPTTVYVLGTLLVITGLITLVLTFWAPGRQFVDGPDPGWAGGREPDRRRPMVWPTRTPAAGPPAPRPPYPSEPGRGGQLGTDSARPWPVVSRPTRPPATYPRPTGTATPPGRDSGPATGYGRAVSDPGPTTGYGRAIGSSGPSTGTGRAVRDPGPHAGGARPASEAEDPWRYD